MNLQLAPNPRLPRTFYSGTFLGTKNTSKWLRIRSQTISSVNLKERAHMDRIICNHLFKSLLNARVYIAHSSHLYFFIVSASCGCLTGCLENCNDFDAWYRHLRRQMTLFVFFFRQESRTFIDIMETEKSWEKLR